MIKSFAFLDEKKGTFSKLLCMYATGTKTLRLEGKGLNQSMEKSFKKICLDSKENLLKYLSKIKDKFPKNEQLSGS